MNITEIGALEHSDNEMLIPWITVFLLTAASVWCYAWMDTRPQFFFYFLLNPLSFSPSWT